MRKAAIPKREIQILRRLRLARETLGLSQPAFASQIKVSRNKYANFESLRTPLPCDLALAICHQFVLGEWWLATGEGIMRQHLGIFVTEPHILRLPYGQAFDTFLRQEVRAKAETLNAAFFSINLVPFARKYNRQQVKNLIDAMLDAWIDELTSQGNEQQVPGFILDLVDAGIENFKKIVSTKKH